MVKLDFGIKGIPSDEKYRIKYQYTLNDNKGVMWLPQQRRDALLRTQAQRLIPESENCWGEPMPVTKV